MPNLVPNGVVLQWLPYPVKRKKLLQLAHALETFRKSFAGGYNFHWLRRNELTPAREPTVFIVRKCLSATYAQETDSYDSLQRRAAHSKNASSAMSLADIVGDVKIAVPQVGADDRLMLSHFGEFASDGMTKRVPTVSDNANGLERR